MSLFKRGDRVGLKNVAIANPDLPVLGTIVGVYPNVLTIFVDWDDGETATRPSMFNIGTTLLYSVQEEK